MFIKINNPYTRFKLFFANLTDEKKRDRMALRALCHVMSSNLYGEKMGEMISEITQIHPNVNKYFTIELLLQLFRKLCREKIRVSAHLAEMEYACFLNGLCVHVYDNPKKTVAIIRKLEIEAFKVFIFSSHDIHGNNLSYSRFMYLRTEDMTTASQSFFASTRINAFLKMKLASELGLKTKRLKFAKKHAVYCLRRAKSTENPKSYFADFRSLWLPEGINRSILLKTIAANCNPAGIDFAISLAELLDDAFRQKTKKELHQIRDTF